MITNSVANGILNMICGKQSSVGVTNIGNAYLGLSSTAPNADGTGFTEPGSGTGYSRVLIGLYTQSATQAMDAASNGKITNSKEIHFNAVNADTTWGTLTHAGVFTSATGGNLLIAGKLGYYDDQDVWHDQPITPTGNQVVTLKTESINFSFEDINQ